MLIEQGKGVLQILTGGCWVAFWVLRYAFFEALKEVSRQIGRNPCIERLFDFMSFSLVVRRTLLG